MPPPLPSRALLERVWEGGVKLVKQKFSILNLRDFFPQNCFLIQSFCPPPFLIVQTRQWNPELRRLLQIRSWIGDTQRDLIQYQYRFLYSTYYRHNCYGFFLFLFLTSFFVKFFRKLIFFLFFLLSLSLYCQFFVFVIVVLNFVVIVTDILNFVFLSLLMSLSLCYYLCHCFYLVKRQSHGDFP